jgi:hypothetical protein
MKNPYNFTKQAYTCPCKMHVLPVRDLKSSIPQSRRSRPASQVAHSHLTIEMLPKRLAMQDPRPRHPPTHPSMPNQVYVTPDLSPLPHIHHLQRRTPQLDHMPRLQRLGINIIDVMRVENARPSATENRLLAGGIGKAEAAPTTSSSLAHVRRVWAVLG